MIPQNSEWEDKIQVKKGDYGEEIIDRYLESKGFVIYKPITKSAHWFDRVAIKNKEQIIIAECKSKARRNKYEDTGFNICHYRQYKRAEQKNKLKVFIFFIDEMMGKVYGNWLRTLETPLTTIQPRKQYPSVEGNIIYFPLQIMRDIAELSLEQIKTLKELSTRKYEYEK